MHTEIKITNVKTLTWGIWLIAAALFILMAFSIERTAWLITIFESGANGHAFGLAAAIIIEIAAIAFIAAEIMIRAKTGLSKLVTWGGLGPILILQTIANGVKGWINGRQGMIDLLGAESVFIQIIATGTWAIVNGLIPLLIFILSKLLASFIAQLLHVKFRRFALSRRWLSAWRRARRAEQVQGEYKGVADALRSTLARYKGQRRRLAIRLKALRQNLKATHTIARQTGQALEKAQADYHQIETHAKAEIQKLKAQLDQCKDTPPAFMIPPMSLDTVAEWIIKTPEATIATLAHAVKSHAKTAAATAQAFDVSTPTLNSWLSKAQPERLELETRAEVQR
jgi:hypothetical protein